ncbi:Thioredoxin C-1 [bioreactor metagenome]|uniref:Thioredoxin C-1 n=1 Tax=bioreactor metagenome TaxID=1076179 RepID=A0A645H685_9ZZZZ|nr:thioredoxin family protein [Candidatus Pelethousia sp.]NCB31071.1 thioredoxin [Clostridia bacterium]
MSMKVITNENFNAEVLEADRPILVEFWAPWCVYCKRLSPVLDRLSTKLGDALPIGTINVDEVSGLEERFGVSLIPTLYLFKNGVHGEKLVAPSSQAQIEAWIQEQGEDVHGKAV